MPEYLDIVDEQDNVIGKDTRDAIHEQHRIHRGIHVFVLNSKKEILIQKRAQTKSDRPGYLDASVGAQVRSGESYEEAAIRETKEELGFTPEKLIKVCDYHSYSDRQRENRRLFITTYNGRFVKDPNEVDSIQFLSIDQIQQLKESGEPFTAGCLISLQHLFKYLE